MDLGNFSVSLAVKDLEASKAFYEKLGFSVFGGDAAQHWLILKNGACVIGLFQGMFDRNILTFNPGWDDNARQLDTFTDVRELQRQLKARGCRCNRKRTKPPVGRAASSSLIRTGIRFWWISTSRHGPRRLASSAARRIAVRAARVGRDNRRALRQMAKDLVGRNASFAVK